MASLNVVSQRPRLSIEATSVVVELSLYYRIEQFA